LEVVSIAYGINCWERIPHSPGLMAESLKAFIGIVRRGHPETPVIVVSPTLYPEAEQKPNVLGSTMMDLRTAVEAAVRELMASGDTNVRVVEGLHVLSEGDLMDGIYPGDEGHKRIAAAVGKHLSQLSDPLKKAAEERWGLEESGIADELKRASEAVRFMENMPITSAPGVSAPMSQAQAPVEASSRAGGYYQEQGAPPPQPVDYANVGASNNLSYQQAVAGTGSAIPGRGGQYPGQPAPAAAGYSPGAQSAPEQQPSYAAQGGYASGGGAGFGTDGGGYGPGGGGGQSYPQQPAASPP
ncbi:lipolytic protein G-D-S-L family, partial [mine drainage metagenome]